MRGRLRATLRVPAVTAVTGGTARVGSAHGHQHALAPPPVAREHRHQAPDDRACPVEEAGGQVEGHGHRPVGRGARGSGARRRAARPRPGAGGALAAARGRGDRGGRRPRDGVPCHGQRGQGRRAGRRPGAPPRRPRAAAPRRGPRRRGRRLVAGRGCGRRRRGRAPVRLRPRGAAAAGPARRVRLARAAPPAEQGRPWPAPRRLGRPRRSVSSGCCTSSAGAARAACWAWRSVSRWRRR